MSQLFFPPNFFRIGVMILLLTQASQAVAQDKRGIGIKPDSSPTPSSSTHEQREAKPELVVQTGYSSFYGATRLVFSPDGKLLATTTFRSSVIKLWDTATGRELRNLSGGGLAAFSLAPVVAFSNDSRLIAGGTSDNTVKVWDVVTGAELKSLASASGSFLASIGISFVGFSADGRRIVSASDAIRVWDTASGNLIREIDGDTLNAAGYIGGSAGLALSADGAQLARAVDEGSKTQIRIWDLNGGRDLDAATLANKEIGSVEVSFASDKHLLAAGIIERKLKVWDITAKSEHELGATSRDHSLIMFSPDGRLVSLCEGYTVRLWETKSGRELPQLKVPNTGVLTEEQGAVFAGFSQNGNRVATSGFGTRTLIWESETARQLQEMKGRSNLAYELAFSPDGSQLLSGGRTRWDLRTGRGLRVTAKQINRSDGLEKSFAMPSPDGHLLAQYVANSSTVTISDTASGRVLQTLAPPAKDASVSRLAFSPDGRLLATTYYEQTTNAPSMSRDAMQRVMKEAQKNPGAASQVYQQEMSRQQAGHINNQVKVWDTATGKELQTLSLPGAPGEVRFSLDGNVLATLGSSGIVTLWDPHSGTRLRDLTSAAQPNPMGTFGTFPTMPAPGTISRKGKPAISSMPNMADLNAMITNVLGTMSAGTMGKTVTSVAFSADGNLVAAGGVESKSNIDTAALMAGAQNPKNRKKNADPKDLMKELKVEATGQIMLWDSTSGRELATLKGHGKGVSQVALSRDGKLLASGATDNTIKIWDVSSQRELRLLTGHRSAINSLAFSPDDRLLASASDDGGTFLWDLATGEHLLTLVSLDDGNEWLVVTPDGLFDGTPVSWNQILWRYNREIFNVAPIEWFFTEFYYPGLLADVVAGKRPHVAQDVSKKDRRQPQLSLSLGSGQPIPAAGLTTRTVKVKVDVSEAPADRESSRGSGAQDIRLFRNGTLVKVWRGDVLKGQGAVSLETDITLVAGDNNLVAYGFNSDNVKSKDASLTLTGADNLKRSGTAYVIAVGINQYANPQYNLKYAVADAQDFSDEVRRRQLQLSRFEQVVVVPLLNQEATKANLLATLRQLATGTETPAAPSLKAGAAQVLKRAEPEDAVIIYFAGHGTAQGQRFYLIPHDLGYTGNRRTLDQAGLKTVLQNSISDVELEQAFEQLDSSNLLLVIDACNSGQALESEEKRRGPMNSRGLAQLAYEKGMYILTAAQSFQAALEANKLGHGLLTYVLVEEGLKTSSADNEPHDGIVSAREWMDFATERVPQMQEEKMNEARGVGLDFAFTEDEQRTTGPDKRSVQRPRVFYRKEVETNPLVVAKP